jgi:CPA1 family monovalent cation:H+ antiporter
VSVLDIIAILVFLAAAFTFINVRFLRLPSTIGLMTLSLGISVTIVLLGFVLPEMRATAAEILESFDFSEVLLHIMLSFLLFAGAINVNFRKLSEERWTVLALATLGTLMSTFIVGTITFYVLPLLGLQVEFIYCLLFGALISPTDPIAVLAIVQKMNLSKNLQIKIEGESLFNDGVGVVVFMTILEIAHAGVGNVTPGGVVLLFGQEVVGGIFLGIVIGYLGLLALNYVENAHVELEVLITLALVMAGTRFAEFIHVSGPLVMVTLGLMIGREGKAEYFKKITGDYVYKFWHLIDEALNAILFILIGFEVLIIALHWNNVIAGILAIFIALGSRYISVTLPTLLFGFHKTKNYIKGTTKVLTWGGLRGGISVALALSLPNFEYKDLIVTMTYIIVVFSILVQGLTIKRLIRTLNAPPG